MNVFNEAEFNDICTKLGASGTIKDVTVRYETPGYFNMIKSMVHRDRRGEVVFCVVRPNGKIITTTCREYPEGIYRIPTGGIGHNEDILNAVFREIREELGLDVSIRSFAGVIRIRFEYKDESTMFYSYIFILDEVGGRLLKDASDDEISGIREADLGDLEAIVRSLGSISGKWHDWGRFRYITSNAVLSYLRDKCI